MHSSHTWTRAPLLLTALLCGTVAAQEPAGANPDEAEIDSRFDVGFKRVRVDPAGQTNTLTLKYDHKFNPRSNITLELPLYTSVDKPGVERRGYGDVSARVRWLKSEGDWQYGAGLEAVLPSASEDDFGTGRYQLNASAVAVYAVTSSFRTAAVVKQSTSLGGDDDRTKFSNTALRLFGGLILPDGWTTSLELRRTWEHRSGRRWQRGDFSVNKRLDPRWAVSSSYTKNWGGRQDRGALSVTVKHYF